MEKKKVFLVMEVEAYEHDFVRGIFVNEEQAIKFAEELVEEKEQDWSINDVEFERHEEYSSSVVSFKYRCVYFSVKEREVMAGDEVLTGE